MKSVSLILIPSVIVLFFLFSIMWTSRDVMAGCSAVGTIQISPSTVTEGQYPRFSTSSWVCDANTIVYAVRSTGIGCSGTSDAYCTLSGGSCSSIFYQLPTVGATTGYAANAGNKCSSNFAYLTVNAAPKCDRIISASVTPTSASPGQSLTIYCEVPNECVDKGCIGVDGEADNINFVGWEGTKAKFTANAKTTSGTKTVRCKVSATNECQPGNNPYATATYTVALDLGTIDITGPTSVKKKESHWITGTYKNSDGSAYANQKAKFLYKDPSGVQKEFDVTTDSRGIVDSIYVFFDKTGTWTLWFANLDKTKTSAKLSVAVSETGPGTGQCLGDIQVEFDKTDKKAGDPLPIATILVTNNGDQTIDQGKIGFNFFEVNCDNYRKTNNVFGEPGLFYSFTDLAAGETGTVKLDLSDSTFKCVDYKRCFLADVFFCSTPFKSENPCYVGVGDPNKIVETCWKEANGLNDRKNVDIKYGGCTGTTCTGWNPQTSLITVQGRTDCTPTTPTTPTTEPPSTVTVTITTVPPIPPLLLECDGSEKSDTDCNAGSECQCEVKSNCNSGLWIIKNKEGNPLPFPKVEDLPPSKITYTPNNTGKVTAIVICFSSQDSPFTRANRTDVTVKGKFLSCPVECRQFEDCSCSVTGCNDGKFLAIQGSSVLKREDIKSTSYTAKFNPTTLDNVEVTADCSNPSKEGSAKIRVVPSITTTSPPPTGEFVGKNFVCEENKCSLDYENGLNQDVIVIFALSNPDVVDTKSVTVTDKSGIIKVTFDCTGKSDTYSVTWKAFKASDKTKPIAWSTSDEIQTVSCE